MQPRPLNLITFQLPDEDSGTGFDLEVVGTDIKDPNASTHLQVAYLQTAHCLPVHIVEEGEAAVPLRGGEQGGPQDGEHVRVRLSGGA